MIAGKNNQNEEKQIEPVAISVKSEAAEPVQIRRRSKEYILFQPNNQPPANKELLFGDKKLSSDVPDILADIQT